MNHEQWLASLSRERAELVREGEAAELQRDRALAAGRTEAAGMWETVASECYALAHKVAVAENIGREFPA